MGFFFSFFPGCFDRMCLSPPVTSESLIWANEISICTLPSHSAGFCAVTPLRFNSIYEEISLRLNEVERSKFREQSHFCCGHWSKSVNQDHRPVSPSSWERLKLHRSHVGLFWAATESGRGQATGSRDRSLLLLLHVGTLTGRRAKECCAPHHQVSVSSGCYTEEEEPSLSIIPNLVMPLGGQFHTS